MMPQNTAVRYYIPDTLRSWPWPRHRNPNYEVCKAESSSWCESFHAFSPQAQKAFNACDFNLLASLAFPLLNKDGCRIGCDLMNLFFVTDEHSDVADGQEARRQANIVMDALRNPNTPRPAGEWVGGEVTRQFWENAIRTASPSAQRRFVDAFQLYTDSVVKQAEDRTHNYIRDIESYFDVRRDTIGAKPSFAILEVQMSVADEVFDMPSVKTLVSTCIDMLILGNDICSYNVEQARGDDGHNIVKVVMNERKTDLRGAFDWISKLHDELAVAFLKAYKFLCATSDKDLATYIDGLGNWVRANDAWSFESERYFGKRGAEIQVTRVVDLLPKKGDHRIKVRKDKMVQKDASLLARDSIAHAEVSA